jgi:hypothetical protein
MWMDMRQGPHKNRSRSRGRRPTGGGNQSGRVYESNGPDVKVRGTAQTVADKYLQLARDAHSAGDTVMAEGYFQHAEHYLRIVAAAQPPQQNTPQRRDDYAYDDGDEDDDQPTPVSGATAGGNGETQRQPQQQQFQQQPAPQANDGGDAEQLSGQSSGQSGGQDGEQPWGGPEPEFLRRGPANGSGRSRRTRQPRSGNGRKDASPSGNDEAADDAGAPDASGHESPGHDTTEQA